MDDMEVPRCVHCGRELRDGLHLNPWLPWPSYECRPLCEAGRRWHQINTWETVAGRSLTPEAAELTAAERVGRMSA